MRVSYEDVTVGSPLATRIERIPQAAAGALGPRHADKVLAPVPVRADRVRGSGFTCILKAIRDDERAVLTVSGWTPDLPEIPSVVFSLPRVVGRAGLLGTLMPELDDSECAALRHSAEVLLEAEETGWVW